VANFLNKFEFTDIRTTLFAVLWLVLIYCVKKILLAGWWLVLVWCERKTLLAGCSE